MNTYSSPTWTTSTPLKEILESLWIKEDWSQTNFGLGASPEVLEQLTQKVAFRVNAPFGQVSAAI